MGLYEKKEQLVNDAVAEMTVSAQKLGELNETASEEIVLSKINDLSQGVFNVMFMGTFNAGKSTTINALLSYYLLRTGPTPETAVITKVVFNSPENKATVYSKEIDESTGKNKVKVYEDLDEFFELYRVDDKDTEKFLKTIDNVIINTTITGIAGSMVQLVDTPGTKASEADDQITGSFFKKTDAIVYVVSAANQFQLEDKRFLEKFYYDKHREDIFFVINKFNLIPSYDQDRVKKSIEDTLEKVFIDKNGKFNKELHDKRVFFVNSFGAFNTRMGKDTEIAPGFSVRIPEDQTGIPEFEAALAEFLNSNDKEKIALDTYKRTLATYYVEAEKNVNNRLKNIEDGLEKINQDLDKIKVEEDNIRNIIKNIENKISNTKKDIIISSRELYQNFVDDVIGNWDSYFAENKPNVNASALMKAAGNSVNIFKAADIRNENAKANMEIAFADVNEAINAYLVEAKTRFDKNYEEMLSFKLEELSKSVADYIEQIGNKGVKIDFSKIAQLLNMEKYTPSKDNDINIGQLVVAMLGGDPELMVDALDGKTSNGKFAMKSIGVNIMEHGAVAFLGAFLSGFLAAIPVVIWKAVKFSKSVSKVGDELIKGFKNALENGEVDDDGQVVCKSLSDRAVDFNNNVEFEIGGALTKLGVNLTQNLNQSLNGKIKELEEEKELLEKNENALEEETARTSKLLGELATSISNISKLTTGTELSADDIKNISTEK